MTFLTGSRLRSASSRCKRFADRRSEDRTQGELKIQKWKMEIIVTGESGMVHMGRIGVIGPSVRYNIFTWGGAARGFGKWVTTRSLVVTQPMQCLFKEEKACIHYFSRLVQEQSAAQSLGNYKILYYYAPGSEIYSACLFLQLNNFNIKVLLILFHASSGGQLFHSPRLGMIIEPTNQGPRI